MAKNQNKTKPTKASIGQFLDSLKDSAQRQDAKALDKILREITGEKPQMWGPAIVGYGAYHYRYPTGREGDMLRAGFSPRKGNLTLYVLPGFKKLENLLAKLGPHRLGKSCLYLKRLESVHLPTLKQIIKKGWQEINRLYPK